MIKPLPLSPRTRRWCLALGILVAVIVVIATYMIKQHDGSSQGAAKASTDRVIGTPATPLPGGGKYVPTDLSILLTQSRARMVSGVPTLRNVSESGTETRSGRIASIIRYATTNVFYPTRSTRYVEVSMYKGVAEYVNLRDQSFDANTGMDDWYFSAKAPELLGANAPFVSTRYAKDGSQIRTLGFTFNDATIKIEVCNLPTPKLMKAAKVVIANLEKLDSINAV